MLHKILGKKKKGEEEEQFDPALVEKIAKMDLTSMRLYVKSEAIDVDGIILVMQRLITPNEKGLYYLKDDDMDTKKKKAFDLVLLICESKKISSKSIELIQKFIEIYQTMIQTYDTKHKEIYKDRFKKGIECALITLQTLTHVHTRIDVLK